MEEPRDGSVRAVPLPQPYPLSGIGQALLLAFPPKAPADYPPDIAALLVELSSVDQDSDIILPHGDNV